MELVDCPPASAKSFCFNADALALLFFIVILAPNVDVSHSIITLVSPDFSTWKRVSESTVG